MNHDWFCFSSNLTTKWREFLLSQSRAVVVQVKANSKYFRQSKKNKPQAYITDTLTDSFMDEWQKIEGNCEKVISFFYTTLGTRFLEQFVDCDSWLQGQHLGVVIKPNKSSHLLLKLHDLASRALTCLRRRRSRRRRRRRRRRNRLLKTVL